MRSYINKYKTFGKFGLVEMIKSDQKTLKITEFG